MYGRCRKRLLEAKLRYVGEIQKRIIAEEPMILHQLSSDMEITFQIRFCAYRIIISAGTLVKTATHCRCGKVLTNLPAEMDRSSSTKQVISEYRNSDFQFFGFMISQHKNIHSSQHSNDQRHKFHEYLCSCTTQVPVQPSSFLTL